MVEEGLEIVRATVAVVNVIGMLPNVGDEQRLRAEDKRVLGVGRLAHGELAVLDLKPDPARSELPQALGLEFFLELVDRAERGDYRLLDLARNRAAAIGFHPLPIVTMIIVLRDVVEDRDVLAV